MELETYPAPSLSEAFLLQDTFPQFICNFDLSYNSSLFLTKSYIAVLKFIFLPEI